MILAEHTHIYGSHLALCWFRMAYLDSPLSILILWQAISALSKWQEQGLRQKEQSHIRPFCPLLKLKEIPSATSIDQNHMSSPQI